MRDLHPEEDPGPEESAGPSLLPHPWQSDFPAAANPQAERGGCSMM